MNGTSYASAPTIEVVVTPTGQTTVRTTGFAGPTCRDASRFLEQALGEATAEHLTAEFHQAQPSRHSQDVREA